MHSLQTGIVDVAAVAAAYARDVAAHGGEIRTGAAVRAVVDRPVGRRWCWTAARRSRGHVR